MHYRSVENHKSIAWPVLSEGTRRKCFQTFWMHISVYLPSENMTKLDSTDEREILVRMAEGFKCSKYILLQPKDLLLPVMIP